MFKKALPLVTQLTTPRGITYNQPLGLFINNEYVLPQANKTFEVISPSTEEKITDVYEGLAEDVNTAVDAAKAAYDNGWALGPPEERARVLFNLADLVEENAETLAQIETWDNGKSLQNARGDIALTAAYFRSCGGWADKITGSQINTGSSHFNYTQRVPMVCGQMYV
ncbi:conserved hypothetical protein [Candida tropicalis MYA-3404]|uniref:Aldehyde dehydrogenase domain-containing protein n=1 Tax=Candida tropicalis (strain ATCC MYA-3404 / T1) TaxID=294747 RepID=C5M648_CANTT|nr:conserved hypothetical protein [Candida tropicalis MYA-3404]EER34468.1 conserved hypothetical protein [Candida tropicalis MYA-3404]MCP8718840.1 aldehyde dehydrogenase family protein [Asgard group archaeon]